MKWLNGLLVLLLCQTAGEAVKAYWQLPLPGPVIGMFILFTSLCIVRGTPEGVAKCSQALIPLLGLLFLPASAGLFFLGAAYNQQWLAILAAVVLGSFLSLLFNGLVMKWLSKGKES